MFPYWILFSLFAAGALQNQRRARAPSALSPLFFFSVVVMIVLVGLRYEVGADWFAYEDIFQQFRYAEVGDMAGRIEVGYAILNFIAFQLGLGVWAVNVVCAAVLGFGLMRFASLQPNPWLAVLVAVPYLVIVIGMSATRQATAIGFILLALPAFTKRAWLQFGLWSLLAVLFHTSAIVVVLLAGLALTKSTAQNILLGGLTAVVGSVLLSSNIETLVERYSDVENQSEGALIRVVLNLIPALLYVKFARRFRIEDHEKRIWRNFAFLSFACVPLLFIVPSSTAVDRLALYAVPLQVFVFSWLPAIMARPKERNAITAGILAYSAAIQLVWLFFSNHADYWSPYRFYPFAQAVLT